MLVKDAQAKVAAFIFKAGVRKALEVVLRPYHDDPRWYRRGLLLPMRIGRRHILRITR